MSFTYGHVPNLNDIWVQSLPFLLDFALSVNGPWMVDTIATAIVLSQEMGSAWDSL